MTRGKSTRPTTSSKINNSEGEDANSGGGQRYSGNSASPVQASYDDHSAARCVLQEDRGETRVSGAPRSTNIKGSSVEGSPDGVHKIANESATANTETSELSAHQRGVKTTGIRVNPDEGAPPEAKGRPQEAAAAGLEASSKIGPQSGRIDVRRIDVQDEVEMFPNGQRKLLYATKVSMESPRHGGQIVSPLAEASCSCPEGSLEY